MWHEVLGFVGIFAGVAGLGILVCAAIDEDRTVLSTPVHYTPPWPWDRS